MSKAAALARKVGRFGASVAIGCCSPVLSPLVWLMARTGIGTDSCLRRGALPVPVHFYSPIPDLQDLAERRVWSRRSELPGPDWCPEKQLALLKELGAGYSQECVWPLKPTSDPYQFHFDNTWFSYGCAASLHCLLRNVKPRRVVEVGSGLSSRVISAALGRNAKESSAPAEYTIVDPYPRPEIASLPGLTRLLQQRVELLEPEFFATLGRGDVLFVNSGHAVRIGGDVNFLILEVLPRLAPGVVVHFHDIPLPFEYPKVYATNPSFRMFWTEAYLLQAFLACNDRFEVLLAMQYLIAEHADAFRAAFPLYDGRVHRLDSGSFWIRRKPV